MGRISIHIHMGKLFQIRYRHNGAPDIALQIFRLFELAGCDVSPLRGMSDSIVLFSRYLFFNDILLSGFSVN